MRLIRSIFAVAALSLAVAPLAITPMANAAPPKAPAKPAAGAPAWVNTVAITPGGGHRVGNPDAPIKLTEYMSYTCPHCAHFEAEGVKTMQMSVIPQGKVSLEIRHYLRDPVDATVAVLVNCAPTNRFFVLHDAFLAAQVQWLSPGIDKLMRRDPRWFDGPQDQRMRNIANDLKLYDFVARFGIARPQADRCLANLPLARAIAAQTAEAVKLNIDSTPSFALDGVVMTGTHDWATLRPQIEARL